MRKLLVANRGEIAVRVLRTARALGYRTVAVFSEADRDSPHVTLADEAVCIGEPPPRESYLSIERLLDACRRTDADALHPGYGFLSENPELAAACEAHAVTFVGPRAETMRLMGDKARAKTRVAESGVPIVPGYHDGAQDNRTLVREAAEIGFPILVKAAAGGGGRGMRIARRESELAALLDGARAEAAAAFGNGSLLLERLIEGARHIEVQIFGDKHGNVIHLGERDCSAQRRHQKVIEESPSPTVADELRQRMGGAAVTVARAIGYTSAGTVEFIVAPGGELYFIEMNTRLQVEHAVTELVTGLDLVGWQLLVAEGHPLPLRQEQVTSRGHAIEARLYAEDANADFAPQTGTLALWREPRGEGVRIDAGVCEGQEITPHYDPLLAKLIAHGATREVARRRLLRALEQTAVLGVRTNREYLAALLDDEVFTSAAITTRTLDTWRSRAVAGDEHLALAAVLSGSLEWDGWRSTGVATWTVALELEDDSVREVEVLGVGAQRWLVRTSERTLRVAVTSVRDGELRCEIDRVTRSAWYTRVGGTVDVQLDGVAATFRQPRRGAKPTDTAIDSRVVAPMSGQVLSVLVAKGDAIERGEPVVVLTAMKMEYRVPASTSGRVFHVGVAAGEQVSARQLLVEITEPS